jgi:hypothetical protein
MSTYYGGVEQTIAYSANGEEVSETRYYEYHVIRFRCTRCIVFGCRRPVTVAGSAKFDMRTDRMCL